MDFGREIRWSLTKVMGGTGINNRFELNSTDQPNDIVRDFPPETINKINN